MLVGLLLHLPGGGHLHLHLGSCHDLGAARLASTVDLRGGAMVAVLWLNMLLPHRTFVWAEVRLRLLRH